MLSKQCVSRSSEVSPIFPLYYHPASQKFIHLFFSISGAKVEPYFLFILGTKIDLSFIFHFRLCSSSFFSFGVYCTLIILALTWVLVVFECQEPQCNAMHCNVVKFCTDITCIGGCSHIMMSSTKASWLVLKNLRMQDDFHWKLSKRRLTFVESSLKAGTHTWYLSVGVSVKGLCVISHTVCNFTHSV